jgi:hypothetical protein
MKYHHEGCQGCLMYDNPMSLKNVRCFFIRTKYEKYCPCCSCLVKVVCEDPCQERRDVIHQKVKYDNSNNASAF